MTPRTRALCQVCNDRESKYTCPGTSCLAEYCSVACYRQHKETSCRSKKAETGDAPAEQHTQPLAREDGKAGDEIPTEVPLRPLTSLKWPYVPDESAYPDPLKRDDPKPLQTAQYEAIATSAAVRAALAVQPGLRDELRRIDGLRGFAREEALQAGLGVSRGDVRFAEDGESRDRGAGTGTLRGLAEAIEAAVRGDRRGTGWSGPGLEWSKGDPERE
ncbi:hypothetical protein BC826DRAFT_1016176 [Russula brevipes]|nr:hypothetical protein BC826DRAFT_1016176 [Russula brevipes]